MTMIALCCGCARGVSIRHGDRELPAVQEVYEAQEFSGRTPELPVLPVYEKLTYEVRWLGFHIGSLTLAVLGTQEVGGRPVYLLEGTMSTNNLLSKVYPIRDRYLSYMDTQELYTLRHEVYRRDGGYRKDAVTDFDQKAHTASFENMLDGSKKTFPVPLGVHDLLTSFYHLCLIPLAVGDTVEYYVCNNEKNYRVSHAVRSTAIIRLSRFDDRAHEAFLIEPVAYRLEGEKVEKGTVKAYLSVEPRRHLLFAEIKGPVFTKVTISLIGQESHEEGR